MSKSAEAWMPLYVGDYLGDTQRLTTEQHGAYILMILDYWRNGPAPDDDAVLQTITKLDRNGWRKHRPALERMFRIVGGQWTHKRIDAEIVKAKDNQERRSSKASKAAQARWGDAPSNAPSMPQAVLDECPPPSPSSSPKGSEETSEAKASSVARTRAKPHPFPCPDGVDPQHWADFQIVRKGKGCVNTLTAYNGILSALARFSTSEWPPGRLVQRSAEKNWAKIVNPLEQDNRNGRSIQAAPGNLRGTRPDPALDMWRAADAEERAAAAYSEAGGGDWPALPPE